MATQQERGANDGRERQRPRFGEQICQASHRCQATSEIGLASPPSAASASPSVGDATDCSHRGLPANGARRHRLRDVTGRRREYVKGDTWAGALRALVGTHQIRLFVSTLARVPDPLAPRRSSSSAAARSRARSGTGSLLLLTKKTEPSRRYHGAARQVLAAVHVLPSGGNAPRNRREQTCHLSGVRPPSLDNLGEAGVCSQLPDLEKLGLGAGH